MVLKYFCLILFIFNQSTYGVKKLPSYIEKCKLGDGFNECATISANKAIPRLAKGDASLGFPVMDPFKIKHVVLIDTPDLSFNLTKATILGLRNLQMLNTTMTDKHVYHALFSSNLTLIGNYEINGKMLVLPISGQGSCEYNFINVTIVLDIDYEIYKKENESYIRFVNRSIDLFPRQINIRMDNLFGGDPVLGNQMNKFLNENWEEAYRQFRPHVSRKLNDLLLSISNIITSLPISEILLQ